MQLKKGMLVKNKRSGNEGEITDVFDGFVYIRRRNREGKMIYPAWHIKNIEEVKK